MGSDPKTENFSNFYKKFIQFIDGWGLTPKIEIPSKNGRIFIYFKRGLYE